MIQTFDWYLLATPLFGIFVLLSLITMKISLKSQTEISPYELTKIRAQQNQRTQKQEKTITQKYSILRVLNYLVRNHTFIQVCLTRKSKNKLPILLSFSAISCLCWINPNIIINCVVGLPLALSFVIAQTCIQPDDASTSIMDGQAQDFNYIRQQVKNDDNTFTKSKYLYIFYGVLASGLALLMCGLTFKNYSNNFLNSLLTNIAISFCADIFVVRFIGFLLLSFPFSLNHRVLNLIQAQKLKQIYQQTIKIRDEQKQKLKNCASKLSPRKKQANSPTKVPRALPKLNIQNSQNQTLRNALQLANRIKRQCGLQQSDLITTLNRFNQVSNNNQIVEQYSLNQLFEQAEKNTQKYNKGRQTPVAMFGSQDEYQTTKTKKKDTDLVIVEFKKNQQNSQEQQHQDQIIHRKGTSFLHSNLDFQDQINNNNKRQDSQTICYDNRLNIIKLLNQCTESIQSQQRSRQRSRKSQNSYTLNLDRHDPLRVNQISQIVQQGEMQQIDCNSPERRRRRINDDNQQSQNKLKKKAKHYNGNAKRRVIKFTSGQPYLQYLPHMLSKDNQPKHKKSQPINVKPQLDHIIQDRRKSLRKIKTKKQPKFVYGGDQNQFPGAMEVQDI